MQDHEKANLVTESGIPPAKDVPGLRIASQEGRIRQALGVVRGSLPQVERQWLKRYYDYLAARLSFPFEATYPGDPSSYRQLISRVTVTGLVDPEGSPAHEDLGLLGTVRHSGGTAQLPLADLEVHDHDPNSELIEDYWYWFWNWRFDPKI